MVCTALFFAKVKKFSFLPKTMDYIVRGFDLKLRSLFAAFLLLAGWCYEAEICAVLLPLRYAFAFFVKIKSFGV